MLKNDIIIFNSATPIDFAERMALMYAVPFDAPDMKTAADISKNSSKYMHRIRDSVNKLLEHYSDAIKTKDESGWCESLFDYIRRSIQYVINESFHDCQIGDLLDTAYVRSRNDHPEDCFYLGVALPDKDELRTYILVTRYSETGDSDDAVEFSMLYVDPRGVIVRDTRNVFQKIQDKFNKVELLTDDGVYPFGLTKIGTTPVWNIENNPGNCLIYDLTTENPKIALMALPLDFNSDEDNQEAADGFDEVADTIERILYKPLMKLHVEDAAE